MVEEHYIALKSKPCMDCGVVYPPCVMEFDHVRGEKRCDVSFVSNSLKSLLAEVAKCDLVCANCHRLRTWARRIKS